MILDVDCGVNACVCFDVSVDACVSICFFILVLVFVLLLVFVQARCPTR